MSGGRARSREGDTLAARLTNQFYEWEIRGRGWDLWNAPVEPEPSFVPFFGHFDPNPVRVVDDGQRQPFWTTLVSNLLGTSKISDDQAEEEIEDELLIEPIWLSNTDELAEIQIVLPPEAKVSKDSIEQFVHSLGRCSRPIAFEIVAAAAAIHIQYTAGQVDARRLAGQLKAFFPESVLTESPLPLVERFATDQDERSFGIVEFGLRSECVRPLRRFGRFDPDPLAGVIGATSALNAGETAVFQTLFMPAVNPWAESMLRAVTDGGGGSFFLDDPSMLTLTGQKVSAPLFGVVLKIAAEAKGSDRVLEILEGLAASLRQFNDPRSNELVPLLGDEYDPLAQRTDLLRRQSRRSGMLLNSDELISFIHPPSASVREPKLLRSVRTSKAAPEISRGHRMTLGLNDHAGRSIPVSQAVSHRLKHTHVVGASGTGKSTLLLNMILQDVRNGDGIAVLDPHGDLIEEILARVPPERTEDIVLIDPADEEYTVGFNILSAQTELEKSLLSSDLVSTFQRLSTSWGDQMTVVLANAIGAFLESSAGGTLADLRRFLVEPPFRKQFLETVEDSEILYYWQKEYPLLRGNPHAPILTRLNTFLRPKPIRRMVTASEKCLDLFSIMNEQKILLVKLSQGLIGEENSYLLGTLLVAKLNQGASSRQQIDSSKRTPFFLYVDEFHHFITPSMAAILSGARKYGLGLVLAHQDLQQISGRDTDVASAVISNPYTRICFRLGDFDAKKLADGFAFFGAQDLQNLSVGEAVGRIERAEFDFNLRTEPLPPLDEDRGRERAVEVRTSSRQRYAARTVPKAPQSRTTAPEIPPPDATLAARRSAAITAPPAAPPTTQPPRNAPATSPVPPSPGRGGQQHKYLQELVKKWAESHGYRATIEKMILDGLGSVDVSLEREGFSVACEVSVTTSPEHELGNVEKCLAAGFDRVVVLATRPVALKKIAKALEALEASERDRVHVFQPEELFAFLEAQAAPHEESQTVRGYKVRVTRSAVSAAEATAKKRVIAGAIFQSLRRLKDSDP